MGGSQYQAKMLIEHLLQTGRFEIYYLTRWLNPDKVPKGYQIIKISDIKGVRRHGYFFDAVRLYRLLKEIDPDVIYQMVGSAYTGIAAYYAGRSACMMTWRVTSDRSVCKSRAKGWRDFFPDKFLERKFTEYGIAHADQIVVQTELQGRLLMENYGRAPTATVRNYHPAPSVAEIHKSEPVTVLWIANFKRLKQPELFVKLARDLRGFGNVRFIMAGAPAPKKDWFRQLTDEIRALDNLEYRGTLTQDQVNVLLGQSHILVNTSEYEGFSNTFIQAWMREVPVVSLYSNPDGLLDAGFLGYCAGGDYYRLLHFVKVLLTDPGLARSIGNRARKYALDAYSEKNLLQLIELLDVAKKKT